MKQLIIVALIGIALLGCNKENSNCGFAYLGGEIINPNNDHIVLYDSSRPVDTIYLDENNRFYYKFENLTPGLFSFVHGGEYQVVLLEPNDSVMIRLNTLDFDESLVFTGRGAKKNNFLIELFVKLETEDKNMYKIGEFEPHTFQKTVDSISNVHYQSYDQFLEKNPGSELFSKMALASIDYSNYARKELFPFRYYNKKEIKNRIGLPKDFYAYRSKIKYNDSDLKEFYPYYNFMFSHIDNLALDSYFSNSTDTIFNRSDIQYNLTKLDIIDSLIKDDFIKNNLLKYNTRNYLTYNISYKEGEKMYDSFMSKCNSEEDKEYIKEFNVVLKKLQPGNPMPDIEVVDKANHVHNINDLINKPTVIYFWSKAIKSHFINSHSKVDEFKAIYPDINFISINIDIQNKKVWHQLLEQSKFDTTNEYRFKYPTTAKKALAVNYINKVMIIGVDGQIIDPNAKMFDWEFSKVLDKLK